MAKQHWEHEAFSNAHGQLHRALGVPIGKPIPVEKLRAAVKRGGKNARRAQLVLNADHPLH